MSAARSSRTTRMTFRIRTCGIRWFKRRCTLQFPWFRLARQDSAKVATVASSNPAQALNLRGRSMRPVMSRVRTRRATTKGFRVRLRDADSVQDANVWQLSTGAQRVDRGGAHSELLRRSCNRNRTSWTPVGPRDSCFCGAYGRSVDRATRPSRVKLKPWARSGAPWRFGNPGLQNCQGEGRRFEAARRNFDQILSKQEGTCGSLHGLRWTSRLS